MYPSFFPFGTADDCLNYIRDVLEWEPKELTMAKRLVAKKVVPLKTGTELGIYLGVSRKLISAIALHPERYYRTFQIDKASGEKRTIQAPRVFLKTIQRYILECILNKQALPDEVCGFRKGLSCASGARRHLKRRYLWNIDLENFFPTITKARVAQAFESIGYPVKAAAVLASLTCLDGKLPQGAPTSPALANYIFSLVDVRISKVARSASVVYTRYADDLSFSSVKLIDPVFQKKVVRAIQTSGFHINRKKSRLMGPGCGRQVTGLTVNERVSIPRIKRRQLRACFHNVAKNPGNFTAEKDRLIGIASWVYDIHPGEGRKYINIAHAIPGS